ncbi:MAG: hypothetical protein KF744_08540 [Taibaiella sp.]|nr:hypothetical protein [Taibaiella sp.]
MKKLSLVLLFAPIVAFCQSQKDYERTFTRFVEFYNKKQADSIAHMWFGEDGIESMWNSELVAKLHTDYGKLQSYSYLGIDKEDPNSGLAVFKTKFSKAGWKTTSFTIESNGSLGTFRFITSSDGIDKLLKEEKQKGKK